MLGLGICFTTVFTLGHCGQSATRGNSISLWNSSYDIVATLPRPVNRCGVVIVNVPRSHQRAPSYHHVRPWLLREALLWLKANNSLYNNVAVDEEMLQDLPQQPLPTVDLHPDDHVDTSIRRNEEAFDETDASYEESFVMRSLDEGQLEDEKMLEVLTGTHAERAYPLPPAGDPMNEFTTKHLMQACFPTLFPDGKGGFHPLMGEHRCEDVALADYCAHLMTWHDRRFVLHPTFKFFCLNLIQRRQVDGLMKRITVGPTAFPGKGLQNFVENQTRPVHTMHNTKQYLKELKPFFRSVRGTGLYWWNVRSDLKSMIGNPALENPWPTFFVTLSAADTVWPDFFRVCDPNLSFKDAAKLSSSQRQRYLNDNPDLAANHFQRRFLAFFNHILRGKEKPLGEIADFFWRIEFQRRGSPHVHALLWIKNAPNILEMSKSEEGLELLRVFADKFVSCLAKFTQSSANGARGTDPLCLRPPPKTRSAERDRDLGLVVQRVQQHVCAPQSSCQRNGKCRFGFPKPIQTDTKVVRTEENGIVTIKFDHKRDNDATNNYNPALLSVWRANMDIQIIGNAYGAAEYTASYVSKAEPDTVRFHRTVERALQKLPVGAPHSTVLRSTANALLGSREVSAQEAIYILSNTLCLHGKSRTVLKIKVTRHSKRYYRLDQNDSTDARSSGTSDVRVEPIEQAYMLRPQTDAFDSLTYRQFCELYEISAAAPAINQRLERWALLDRAGYIKARSQKQVVRPSPYLRADESNADFCFAQMMLYRPWRTLNDLPEHDDEVMTAYNAWKSLSQSIWIPNIVERIEREQILAAATHPPVPLPPPEWRIQLDRNFESRSYLEPEEMEMISFAPRQNYSREDISRAKAFMKEVVKPFVDRGTTETSGHEPRPYVYPTDDQLESLNDDQWKPFALWMMQNRRRLQALQENKECTQMQMVITGEGGTGKSWLVKHIINDLRTVFARDSTKKRVLLMAHQGSAAHLIGGRTLASALALPSVGCSFRGKYVDLEDTSGGSASLRRLQQEYEHVHLIIIDEYGVISSGMLYWIDQRLRKIFPHHSHLAFGGRDMLFTGDPGQLGPINPSSLSTPKHMLFTQVEKDGRQLWIDIPLHFVLRQQNRGRDDPPWYEMLARVRDGQATEEDLRLINSRVVDHVDMTNIDGVSVAFRNQDVDAANERTLVALNRPILTTLAHHEMKWKISDAVELTRAEIEQLKHVAETLPTSRANYLAPQLRLAIGATVVLTSNIQQQAGLCNGSRGTVYDIMISDEEPQPIVLVQFGSYGGPSFHPQVRNLVPITCQTAPLTVDKKCMYKFFRTALPLRLGFATTIHKIQGQTCTRLVFNPTAMNSSALAYVALSRVRTRNDIVLTTQLKMKQLQPSEKVRAVQLAEVQRLAPIVATSKERANNILPEVQLIASLHNLQACCT